MKISNKKQLYNNIMLSISKVVKLKLNEDLLHDLEDDDDDDSDFIIGNDKNVVKIFYSKPDATFMNKYNNVGDLLTYYQKDLFYVIKNDKSYKEIRRDLNSKYYGKIIGICVGKGLWLSTEYDFKATAWTNDKGTQLYYNYVKTYDVDGWYNTTYIWDKYVNNCKNTVWSTLYNQNISGLGNHICYLPSVNQLKEINRNNNILKIPMSYYLSSTLHDNYVGYVWGINFGEYFSENCIDCENKLNRKPNFALIHFE